MEASAADTIPEYDELKLRVEVHGEGTYDVTAFAPDGGTVTGRFERPLSDEALENFILKMPRARSVRSFQSSQMEKARELGRELFEHLMADDVGDLYHGARRVADSKGRGLRISLSMTGAPDLLEIPWEFLYDPGDAYFLSQSIYTPVVRSLDLKNPREPPKVRLPFQVLALVSAPGGYVELDTGRERANLERALAPLIENGVVRLEWLETATLAELDRRIASRDELHIIHYIGHGAYDEEGTKNGVLILEDANGMPHKVTGEELGGLMRDERSLRFVVLNSCEGARTSHVDPFSGVASSLLRCGLPAVVGMQAEITDDAAVVFSDRLYSSLAEGFPIDAALAQARKAIFAAGHDVEFGTPVLFMRVADGRLFEVVGKAPPPPKGSVAAELRAEPAAVRPGATVTWRAKVTNDGESPLSDVIVRDSDAETRAGPFALAPGEVRGCTWSIPVHPPLDEQVTVGGRGSDGRLVNVQVAGHVDVRTRPPWLWAAAGAVAVGLVALLVALLAGGGGDGDGGGGTGGGGSGGGGSPDVQVFDVKLDAVPDMDVRGDKAAFLAPVGDLERDIRRLNLATGRPSVIVAGGIHNSIDVGLDAAGHARLVYTTCNESRVCDVFTKPFTGPEQLMPASTPRCSEIRPTMSRGLILFARAGEGCTPALLLKPPGDAQPRPLAGQTAGSDLNDGAAVWLAGGTLFAKAVAPNGELSDQGQMEPPEGENFDPPLVVEDGFAYFVHGQGSQTFIARAKLPLGDSEIEHYVPGENVTIAEESPHYSVTAGTLYTTNYPQPNGDPGTGMIVQIRNPTFERAD
jgi:CHAT domain